MGIGQKQNFVNSQHSNHPISRIKRVSESKRGVRMDLRTSRSPVAPTAVAIVTVTEIAAKLA